ncbi:TPA: hypothetical protein ACN335_002087 [Vibrio parahaemolyticus]|uniref:hypothetical protein n=1 Tax=Vibrio parahaemolyticus TaxID=670 RepID=UPI001F466FCB|nr:hypothetical protein [Vibrio parahaemolyticus]EHW0647750.1 hypothetical protein [Vibrio parahaemolyticus]MCG0028127.1 hypothetical protein [Vibrio parahaemolyticus]
MYFFLIIDGPVRSSIENHTSPLSVSVVNGAKFAFEYSAAESQSKSTECFVGGVKVFSWVLSAQF